LRRRTLAALAAAEPADPNDRITAAALREQLEAAEELHGAAEDLADLDNVASPHHAIRNVFDLMPTASAEDWATVVARLGAVPLALRGYAGSLRAAARQGHVVPRRQVAAAIAQCADYGRPDGFFDKLAAGARTAPGAKTTAGAQTEAGPLPDALTAGLAANAAAAAAAYAELGTFLRDELMARAPARDAVGRDLYTLHSRAFLGTRVDLDETYEWGQRELASIVNHMAATAQEIRRDESVDWVIACLDAAPEYTLHGADALRDWMQATSDAAIDALADRHFDIPAPIRRLECLIAPTEEGGIYYTHPSADLTTRPGRMWWSVPRSQTRFSTWKERSTVYHEGVPGHHLQIAQRHLLQLRNQARAAQGAAFDLKSFHRRVLDIGSVGLDVLQAAVLGSEAQ